MNDDRANLTASTHLRSTSLSAWTTQHPASPRRTVHDYLKDQRNHTYPSLALPALASNPAPAFPSSSNNNKSSDSYPRPRASPPEGEGFALVLGREDKENYEAGGTLEVKGKRKVSLVAAMRRRAPSLASHSPADSGRDKRAVSPMLVARVARQEVVEDEEGSIDRILDAALDAGEDLVHNDNGEDDYTSPKRKRASRTLETGKHATKGGATKDAGSDAEDQEVIERLEARRDRRRAKALIVKDRTQSARATGAAAAAKVKKARRGKHDDGGETEDDEEDRKTKKRKSAAATTNRYLQETSRPKNIGGSRLTLGPIPKLGLFSKGAASARVKTGKYLPDLAFSESNFLNPPRRPAAPPSSSSLSSLSSLGSVVALRHRPKGKGKGKEKELDRLSKSPTPPPPIKASTKAKVAVKYGSRGQKAVKVSPVAVTSSSSPSPPRKPIKKSRAAAVVTPPRADVKKKKQAKDPSVSPEGSDEDHSAHSLLQNPRRASHGADDSFQIPPTPTWPSPQQQVLDTSNAWKDAFTRVASPIPSPSRSLSPPPVQHIVRNPSLLRETPSYHPSASGGSVPGTSTLERLIAGDDLPPPRSHARHPPRDYSESQGIAGISEDSRREESGRMGGIEYSSEQRVDEGDSFEARPFERSTGQVAPYQGLYVEEPWVPDEEEGMEDDSSRFDDALDPSPHHFPPSSSHLLPRSNRPSSGIDQVMGSEMDMKGFWYRAKP